MLETGLLEGHVEFEANIRHELVYAVAGLLG
jgi:hypothetical protein